MNKTTLTDVENRLVMEIPKAFASAQNLGPGSEVTWSIRGRTLVISCNCEPVDLQDLLNATPKEAVLKEWEQMSPERIESVAGAPCKKDE